MNDSAVGASEFEPPEKRRRLGRTVFLLPSTFTVGNIFCGYYAIIATMHGDYDRAAQAIGIAIVLDMLDGRIARLTNSATAFGLQLDSLADVISFGIAPSVLALTWGFATLDTRLGWIVAFTFAICGTMRLARFNVQAGHFKHFVGLPIPAGGGTIAAIVHFIRDPLDAQVTAFTMLVIVFILALLMVSTVRYTSFKQLAFGRKSHTTILGLAFLFALIYFYSRWTLLVVAASYTLSGPLHRLYSLARPRRHADEEPLSQPLKTSEP
jgi:CDP-diacylglycerol---serine O-phosphatidyltransferase